MLRTALTFVLLGVVGAAASAQTEPRWIDPGDIAPAPPPGMRSGPRPPHAPGTSTRPASWPGTPAPPSHRAANGDTVIGAEPSDEIVVSDDSPPKRPAAVPQSPAPMGPPEWKPAAPSGAPQPKPGWRRPGEAEPGADSRVVGFEETAPARSVQGLYPRTPDLPTTYPTTPSRAPSVSAPLPTRAAAESPAVRRQTGPHGEREEYGPRPSRGDAAPFPANHQAPSPPLATPSTATERDVRPPAADGVQPVLYERAQALARVGSDVILAGDVTTGVEELRARALEEIRAKNGGRVPPSQAADLDKQVQALVEKRLRARIDTALICQHAARTIPAENLTRIRENIGRDFEKREVPEMMKRAKVSSRRELEEKLQAGGLSLESHKRDFVEQLLAREWLRQQVKPNDEISRAQMLAYYQEHGADFERPARARWEQLTVRVSKYKSRREAYAALAEMGNAVMQGKPLAEVAKASSDGPTALQGGQRDWTTRGALVSQGLDKAIFTLPVGELSPILEDDNLLHIVRVVEREDARRTPFVDAQVEIGEKIRKQREAEAREEFLIKIRKQVPVWTAFDDPAARGAWVK